MQFRVLLADADGTLFNFHRGERVAISNTFCRFGIPDTAENADVYHRVNDAQWKRLERGETTQARLRVDRFTDFLRETGLQGDPNALCDYFVEQLAQQRFPMDGAEAFVRAVSAHAPIWLVTNGIARVQHGRFDDCALTPYLSGMVISEEVGKSKPDPAMLFEALNRAGHIAPEDAILIGDSVTADIAAARNAGIRSILFTDGKEPPANHGADFVARTFDQALAVLGL